MAHTTGIKCVLCSKPIKPKRSYYLMDNCKWEGRRLPVCLKCGKPVAHLWIVNVMTEENNTHE